MKTRPCPRTRRRRPQSRRARRRRNRAAAPSAAAATSQCAIEDDDDVFEDMVPTDIRGRRRGARGRARASMPRAHACAGERRCSGARGVPSISLLDVTAYSATKSSMVGSRERCWLVQRRVDDERACISARSCRAGDPSWSTATCRRQSAESCMFVAARGGGGVSAPALQRHATERQHQRRGWARNGGGTTTQRSCEMLAACTGTPHI